MKEILDVTTDNMKKCISVLEGELATIRAGRANPGVLDKITVDYYGTPTPVNQMASVSVSEARILVVQPYDASTLGKIEKAIQASDLGINPTNDGRVLRIVFPQLTEERRKELCKTVSKNCEDSKVAVRNVRRDALDKLKAKKKSSEITEDDLKEGEKDVQKLTDKYIEEIDKVGAAKEKEIMSLLWKEIFPRTSASSWTETAAGRKNAAFREGWATGRARRCSKRPSTGAASLR